MSRPGAELPFRAPGRRPAGFTLVEILLVLAVIALVSALVLPGLGGIFRALDNAAPDQILWDAVTAARGQALSSNREVWLRFDREKRMLAWTDGLETKSKAWPADVTLQLLQPKEGAMVLIGGQLSETQEIGGVRFYPDGTCDRFRAQIRAGAGSSPAQVIGVDPWTCARVINTEALP
jgi:prepilin-type N-terminal cleavage/methylation domain-containing protein